MLILTIRTDKPEAEVGLLNDGQELTYKTWPAHRQLSVTVHQVIEEQLRAINKAWRDIEGIVCFEGPGSFTGLRIGVTVANTLAYALKVPLVGTSGEDWVQAGCQSLSQGTDQQMIVPHYGAEPQITRQKK